MDWIRRPYIAADTETALGTSRRPVPPLVCWAESDGQTSRLYHHADALPVIAAALERAANGQCNIVFHNSAFDLPVLMAFNRRLIPLVFAALDADAILCTMLADRLLDLYVDGKAKYQSLAALSQRYLGQTIDKSEDTWRLRYGELWHVPLAQWHPAAREYAEMDPLIGARVWQHQLQLVASGSYADDVLLPLPAKVRTHLATTLAVGVRGMQLDPGKIQLLDDEVGVKIDVLEKELPGIVVKGVLKTEPRRALVREVFGESPPPEYMTAPTTRFPGGQVSTSAATMIATGHPLGLKCARYYGLKSKARGTYIRWMQAQHAASGAARGGFINPILDTGRVATGTPMTVPKKGGYRECHRARDGFVLCFIDYDTAELRSLAQACLDRLGWSRLAEVFDDPDADPHLMMAATVLGIDLDEAKRRHKDGKLPERGDAKAPNFGFPGGMGPGKYVATQARMIVKDYVDTGEWRGTPPTEDEAKVLKQYWMQTWPEQKPRFRMIDSQLEGDEHVGRFRVPILGLYAGQRGYCQAANFEFQPLTAAGATDALYEITRRCYVVETSWLYGSRPVAFMHDEIGIEIPEARGHEAAHEAAQVMVDCMHRYTPRIQATASPTLAYVWSKKAKSVTNNEGRLIPWTP